MKAQSRDPRNIGMELKKHFLWLRASLVAQRLKHLPATRETRVWSLGREDLLEKEVATHSSILAWRIPWRKEPGRLQSMGLQRVGHDWATSFSLSLSLTDTDLILRGVILVLTKSGKAIQTGGSTVSLSFVLLPFPSFICFGFLLTTVFLSVDLHFCAFPLSVALWSGWSLCPLMLRSSWLQLLFFLFPGKSSSLPWAIFVVVSLASNSSHLNSILFLLHIT